MSSIPVVVLGIKRAKFKAEATKKHLKDIGFKNVSIYYGLDIKGKNPEDIKSNQVVLYNNQKLMEDFTGNQLLVAEDDLRITDPEGLFKHLKNGINGVDRLAWVRKIESGSNKGNLQGGMLIGYDKSGMNRLMTLPLSAGHIDMAISKNIKQKISGSFGIEYHYKGMKKNVKGEITGMTETHKKTKLNRYIKFY